MSDVSPLLYHQRFDKVLKIAEALFDSKKSHQSPEYNMLGLLMPLESARLK